MDHTNARTIAEDLVATIRPFCERVEIAGSLRRGKPNPKDIEVVAVPRLEVRPSPDSLFGDPVPTNLLYEWASTGHGVFLSGGQIHHAQWLKPGAPMSCVECETRFAKGEDSCAKCGAPRSYLIPWVVQQTGKYWRAVLNEQLERAVPRRPHHLLLDLFLTTTDNFGVIFLIRTGSADFSHELVTHALRRGTRVQNGWLTDKDGKQVITRDEQDVFDYLGLEWVEPRHRTGKEAIKEKR